MKYYYLLVAMALTAVAFVGASSAYAGTPLSHLGPMGAVTAPHLIPHAGFWQIVWAIIGILQPILWLFGNSFGRLYWFAELLAGWIATMGLWGAILATLTVTGIGIGIAVWMFWILKSRLGY